MFNKQSYKKHGQWYNTHFPTDHCKVEYLKKYKLHDNADHIEKWLQRIFFSCIDPLVKTNGESWLTIGDAYGFDAGYILKTGNYATASDLNTGFLSIAKKEGFIQDFSLQNAEQLSYAHDSFDYLLCKEAYHHFPRPYAALYEMIRVARKGFVLIEPQDPISKMPLLLFVINVLSAVKNRWLAMVWKNRFSYEPVGNFVYKLSERELEKFAAGLNLPLVAFRGINPNFYFKGAETIERSYKSRKFRAIFFRKMMIDLAVKLRLIPSQVLSAIIFKELPKDELLKDLEKSGYRLIHIPKNPYV